MSLVTLDTSFLECGNDSLWLLSEHAAKQNTYLIAGGVLAALIAIYAVVIIHFTTTEKSPFKKLLKIGSVRRRELWMNMSFAVALVALNLLLLGGIQINFRETFSVIMTVFGVFSLMCSAVGIYLVASRLKKSSQTGLSSSVVQNATVFMTGSEETASMQIIKATDRYQDFGNELFGTLWLGVAQIILLSMFVYAVYADLSEEVGVEVIVNRMLQSNGTDSAASEQFETDTTAFEQASAPTTSRKNIYAPFYALALFVQIGYVFGKDTVKERFSHILFWGKAYRACKDKKAYEWKSREASTIHPFELFLRSLLSILVNDVGLIILLLVLPLQLSAVNRKDCFDFADKISDFVLNAVAIYYVVEIDNMEEKRYRAKDDKNDSTTPTTLRVDTEDEGEEGRSPSGSEGSNTQREGSSGSFFFDEYDVEEGGADDATHQRGSGRSIPI